MGNEFCVLKLKCGDDELDLRDNSNYKWMEKSLSLSEPGKTLYWGGDSPYRDGKLLTGEKLSSQNISFQLNIEADGEAELKRKIHAIQEFLQKIERAERDNFGRFDKVELLIDIEGPPNKHPIWGRGPLHFHILRGNVELPSDFASYWLKQEKDNVRSGSDVKKSRLSFELEPAGYGEKAEVFKVDGDIAIDDRGAKITGSSSLWSYANRNINADTGTFIIWWKPVNGYEYATNRYFLHIYDGGATPINWYLYYDAANDKFGFYDGISLLVEDNAQTFSVNDIIQIAWTWNLNSRKIYVNGSLAGSTNTYGTFTIDIGEALSTYIYIGNKEDASCPCMGTLWDPQMYEDELTPTEIKKKYYSGIGITELPWMTNYKIMNHDDSGAGDNNWTDIKNIPGELPAKIRLILHNTTIDPYDYVRKLKMGIKFDTDPNIQTIWEGENFNSTTFNVHSSVADATCSEEEYENITTESTEKYLRWASSTQNLLEALRGQYRVYARIQDKGALGEHTYRLCQNWDDAKIWIEPPGGDSTITAPVSNKWIMIDLGTVEFPHKEISEEFTPPQFDIALYIKHSGAGSTVYLDYIFLLPIDCAGIIQSSENITWRDTHRLLLDNFRNNMIIDSSITPAKFRFQSNQASLLPQYQGDSLYLIPGVTNRIYFDAEYQSGGDIVHAINLTYELMRFWIRPRYMMMR